MATAQQTIAQQQIELQSMRSHESELRAASAQLSEVRRGSSLPVAVDGSVKRAISPAHIGVALESQWLLARRKPPSCKQLLA